MADNSYKIPRLPRLTAVPDSVTSNNHADLHGTRVLVVDDERDARDIVAIVLRGAGADVTTAASKEEALQFAKENRFDALVSDISMPGGDGLLLLEELRSAGHEIPAIALSALPWEQIESRVQQAGFALHLEKPTELSSLTAAVADVIGNARGD
ncbi:MAG TPA: response regulator [Abditibacterium sp.]|jgi:CheY-like chemotaxis protein